MSTTATTAPLTRAAIAHNALIAAGGNAVTASATVGIARTTFRRLVVQHRDELALAEADARFDHDKWVGAQLDRIAAELNAAERNAAAATPAAPSTPKADDGTFPEGVLSPWQFACLLIEEGTATAALRPQKVYDWCMAVKTAARRHANPADRKGNGSMPVRFYSADGTVSDIPSLGARYGVSVEAGRAWFRANKTAFVAG